MQRQFDIHHNILIACLLSVEHALGKLYIIYIISHLYLIINHTMGACGLGGGKYKIDDFHISFAPNHAKLLYLV